MDSHSFGETSGFQRVTRSWKSRGSKSGRSHAVSKKTRTKTSRRVLTRRRAQERDDKQFLNQEDYEVMQPYYRYHRADDWEYSVQNDSRHEATRIKAKVPNQIVSLHSTTFCSPVVSDHPPHRYYYKELAPTKGFQILGGGVSWLSSSVFEQDVLLVLATFVPEIGFGGFAHHTHKFPKLHEDSKIVTYAINPVSLNTVEKEEEKPQESQWKIVKKKKDKFNDYAPTPGKEFSWSCKFISARRSDEDCKFLQSQGMRCQRTKQIVDDYSNYNWPDDDGTHVAEMGFEDLETLFEASLIPSDEQIDNLDETIGTCSPALLRERNDSMTIPKLHAWPARPGSLDAKRRVRVEAYAGVNKTLKVFFCMTYFITDKGEGAHRHFTNDRKCYEIYCFDLHEFLCVVSKVNCLLEIREHGKFVYEANICHYPHPI